MTVQECANEMKCSVLFLREWIAQTENHPFGVVVDEGGRGRRTFYIFEERFWKYMKGES